MGQGAGGGPQPRGGATLAQVAARVGVSLNTVSRAIRAPHTLRPELLGRIAAALDELNYVPNRIAGSLAGTRSALVGVVVSSLFHSEFAAVVEALQTGLLARDFQVMLGHSHYDPAREAGAVRALLGWRPAAMALVGIDHHRDVSRMLGEAGIPVVQMWDVGGEAIDSAVGMDHVAIGRAQAEHLLARGYRHVAVVGSLRPHDARAHKRCRGVAQALAAAGLGEPALATSAEPGDPDLGGRLVAELLARHPEVDGIACNSDAVAYGVLRALRARGRRVPDDVGVVGFGDAEASACLVPALTSVRPPRAAIGRLTAEIILARLEGAGPRQLEVAWDILVRDSTARGSTVSAPI
ncbi:LacI family DNA-binding transcriptional regulator [Lichenibacterium ramalinae]|uniref:LacI family DNA-binding transcriptional regulator n=1 Tax=Lichenibacterium ramalinae TaxID=2316527 RepID=A0A4Q2RKU7_9HYPH|nr:LacI family DNA-binding transcriptional regulator [Lichenibacterium ramalinae]RYB07913.1 LacI family DNA-binding transcriptional regulator [Lichenibacterium ramalinae]